MKCGYFHGQLMGQVVAFSSINGVLPSRFKNKSLMLRL